MITAGIDCGAKNTKAVIMKDDRILGKGKISTGFDQDKATKTALKEACQDARIREKDIEKIGGTGAGKDTLNGSVIVNDIKAIARAAHYFFPGAGTVLDVGAEESRAARLDDNGSAVDFAINEKCAAGTGAFIESMGRALETPLEELGPLALESDKEIPMNAQCVIFAESEVVGLIHAKTEKKDISRAIHDSMAGRTVSMLRRIGIDEDIVLMGGVAYNPGFVAAIKRQPGIKNVKIPENPEFAAAVGAALVAAE